MQAQCQIYADAEIRTGSAIQSAIQGPLGGLCQTFGAIVLYVFETGAVSEHRPRLPDFVQVLAHLAQRCEARFVAGMTGPVIRSSSSKLEEEGHRERKGARDR